ncbi:hypothetical protein TRFO_34473 [Tritrichomonas foetus]|uniref:Peptidase M60 domain-containing protein n=1 Tax=Tritrichomonas foetus TaxID=1144522 RepID=A0A1J4JNQ8_9EUKA|nr:hypothetical protein TRFO_34473 [Tritrichomonas foetus]|eukprot:OHS99155.1 hypothetical protein TRFO_34473 [Tritrichomonas foetus]
MGCISSTPRVNPSRQVRPIIDISDLDGEEGEITQPQSPQMLMEVTDFLCQNFNSILTGISAIPKPENSKPLVCLNDHTVPLVIGRLYLSNGDSANISLPIAAIGIYKLGRTACVGNIAILSQCTSSNTEASAFLENISRYCCGMRANYRVLILGVHPKIAQKIKTNLRVFEFSAEVAEEKDDFSKYGVVIISSQTTITPNLMSFLEEGGGLIIGYEEIQEGMPKNTETQKYLIELGYGFPECSLAIGKPNSSRVKSNNPFKKLIKVTLPKLSESLIKLLQDLEEINVTKYDSLVTTLRFHILPLNRGISELLQNLFEKCWEFLDKTNATNELSVCPQLYHGITFVIISEIISKIPARVCENMDRCLPFPGKVGENIELADFKITAEFHCESWVSTGLYLPPGIVATVTLDKIAPNVSIQIGSHTECILSKIGPWNRWAIVTSKFEFDDETIEITSPYGGIVYVVYEESDTEVDIELLVTFRNITRHTSFLTSSPDSFQIFDVPWGEIETQFVIFTVPVDVFTNYPELDNFCNFIDNILSKVLLFTSDQSIRLFRVVFDVKSIDDEPSIGYPIIISIDLIKGIFGSNSKPTAELFSLLTYIATVSMPEGIFEQSSIESFAALAAISAFQDTWEGIDPLQFAVNTPPELFNAMYELYQKHNKSAFIQAFSKVREAMEFLPGGAVPDLWSLFVEKLALETQDKSSSLLKTLAGISSQNGKMVMTYSSSSLSEYQLSEAVAANAQIV